MIRFNSFPVSLTRVNFRELREKLHVPALAEEVVRLDV